MAERPPFILVFFADQQGCGWHRAMVPLATLVEAGVADGRIDFPGWPDDIGRAARPDVIVWQRCVEDGQIEMMRRWREILPDALFIFELDDYLDEIPPASFHASFMPPDIKAQVVRALALCDRVTTTTERMADWLRTLCTAEVIVVPNGLPAARLKERKARASGKLRIGFAGGISHSGDLELLREAMTEIGEAVTWVFFGGQPTNPACAIEHHEGVGVQQYLDKLQTLDIDLMLAPLEENNFNLAKSNLRLLEAAAAGATVIAQDLTPYRIGAPPVFSYAQSPATWTAAIHDFMRATPAARQRSADQLRAWVGKHFTLERLLKRRIDAWLPADSEPWRPQIADKSGSTIVVSCAEPFNEIVERMSFIRSMSYHNRLEDACRIALRERKDLLWLRPAVSLTRLAWDRLSTNISLPNVASVTPLASDGINAFPHAEQWTPLPSAAIEALSDISKKLFSRRQLSVAAATGPVVLLSVRALGMMGLPDVQGCDGNEEQALLEWGLRASIRQWKHVQAIDAFASSLAPPAQPTQLSITRLQARGYSETLRKPSETLTVDEREQMEAELLHRQWAGPRPGSMGFDNDYTSWSQLSNIVPAFDQIKKKIEWKQCAFGLEPYKHAKESWLVFTDDNTVLYPHATYWLSQAIDAAGPDVRVIYADHDSIIGERTLPEFKPDFDVTLFLAQDYVTPICAVRADTLESTPVDRIELFVQLLQVLQLSGRVAFRHIPKVLGSLKMVDHVDSLALHTLERQIIMQEACGEVVDVIASRELPGCLKLRWNWQAWLSEAPLVSIIIPTLGAGRLIQTCVATILQHTDYLNYEIIVVQNGARQQPEVSEAIRMDPRVKIVRYEGDFNWSSINNEAIHKYAKGPFIVTLNDDVCVGSKHWLDAMMGHAAQHDVGVVGAKLIHPMGVLQHVGVVCHYGIAGHMHKGIPNGQAGHLGRAILSHDVSAVTGACMLFSRAVFDAVNGFDERFSHNYNDTAFCLSVAALGKRNVVETAAELLHAEGTSRPAADTVEGMRRLLEDGVLLSRLHPQPDPYWNPNMGLRMAAGGLGVEGLNADMLAWNDFAPAGKNEQRVLLINDPLGDKGCILDILQNGDIPLAADLSGFTLKLTAPSVLNIRAWDIRNVKQLADGLKLLRIDKVIVRSLVGEHGAAPPVEALRVLSERYLNVPVIVDPINFATMAPWLSETPVNTDEVFGYVDMSAWITAYEAAVKNQG